MEPTFLTNKTYRTEPPAFSMLLLLLLALTITSASSSSSICAGCPMEQNNADGQWTGLGKKTFESLQSMNLVNSVATIRGKFSSIESVKTQVVAGTFFTFILKSSLDETIDVKLFKSLPDNDSPRKVTYEVSYAILIRTPMSSVSHTETGGDDLVIITPSDEGTGQDGASSTPLETRGASWTENIVEDNDGQ